MEIAMKPRTLLIGWFIIVLLLLCIIGVKVYEVDPYFHYHKPNTEEYYYTLNSQRNQNDGITKHFEYDALITGSSMTENFNTSEMDQIFQVNSIKIPYAGSTHKEINDSLTTALQSNPMLKTIVRGLDMTQFFNHSYVMRNDLGTYPTYLYDNNIFNDVNYLFNRDVFWGRVYQMELEKDKPNFQPGITAFDDYSNWQDGCAFGKNTVCSYEIPPVDQVEEIHLVESEKEIIKINIEKNITALADQYPDVTFYYFFTPYSIEWWRRVVNEGNLPRQTEAEQYIIELMLGHPNIKLYSFNNRTDITTDLNHYKDSLHYGEWINSLILKWLHEEEYLLTKDNYIDYLEKEYDFYGNFNYESINEQEDYVCDCLAAALLQSELSGVEPVAFSTLNTANNIENGEIELSLPDMENHKYLVFLGKKVEENGSPAVIVYNKDNDRVAEWTWYDESDGSQWHTYAVDISNVEKGVTIILKSSSDDNINGKKVNYSFSDIRLY